MSIISLTIDPSTEPAVIEYLAIIDGYVARWKFAVENGESKRTFIAQIRRDLKGYDRAKDVELEVARRIRK